MALIVEHDSSLVFTKCTLCGSPNTEVAFIKNSFKIFRCNDCNHLFTGYSLTAEDVDKIYSDSYFFDGGFGYNNYTLQKGHLIKRGEYYADKISKYVPTGKLLDVGSAAGFILKGFENKGWIGTGLEPNGTMAAYGREVVGVNIIKGVLGQVEIKEKYDLITLIQVIGQIPNVNESTIEMFRHLNPGGYVLTETWNKDSLTAKIFGKYWHEFSPPATLNYFSKKTLNKLMFQNNFSLVACGTPKKTISSSHAKSFLKHKLLEIKILKWMSGVSYLIPDNMIIPYPGKDLFWSLFKKN